MKDLMHDKNYPTFLELVKKHNANVGNLSIEKYKLVRLETKMSAFDFNDYQFVEIQREYHKTVSRLAQLHYYYSKSLCALEDFVSKNKKYKKLYKKLLTNKSAYGII